MSDRKKAIETLKQLRLDYEEFYEEHNNEVTQAYDMAIASLETDEAYQLEYESTTKNDLDFKLKDYVSREAVRRIIKSPRTQEQMLNALNSLRNATECKAEDCINRDYTAKYVEEFANNEYVSQDEAETIYLIADGIRHIPSVLPKVTKNDLGVDAVSRKALLDATVKKNSVWNTITNSEGDNLETIIAKLPSVIPQEPRKGEWLRMSDLSEQEDDRYKCSHCGNVIHHKNKMNLYTFNSWCGRCGSNNGRHINYEVEE